MARRAAEALRRLLELAPVPEPRSPPGAARRLSRFAAAPPAPPARRVVVTGVGLVTPLAVGAAETWARLVAGHTAVRELRADDLPEAHRGALDSLASRAVACVPRAQLDAAPWWPGGAAAAAAARAPPFVAYALCAAAEAAADAGWPAPPPGGGCDRTGVSIGAGMSCTADMAEAGALLAAGRLRRLSPFFVPRVLINSAAGAVALAARARGPCLAPATACAAGGHALGDAFRAVQRGDADAMLAGGAEACVDAVALAGFGRMRALSTAFGGADCSRSSRPFDAARDGFVLGEGAGVLALEELGRARARGARVYAELRGFGASGDAHHATTPPADGRGAAAAVAAALAAAGLAPADVAHVNAHATGTPAGDAAEARALAAALGPAAAAAAAVSATKGATGHLLGAAGAVEAAFAALAVFHGVAPPTVNLDDPDPAVAAALGNLVGAARGGAARLPPPPRAALSNSFGFGGTNTCLVFATPPGEGEE